MLATYAMWATVSVRVFPRLWPLVLAYPGALIGATHAQTGLLTGVLLVFAAAATVLALLALSALVFGPAILTAYTASGEASAKLLREADRDFLLRMCSLYAPLRLYAGAGFGLAVAGLLALAMIAVALLAWRRFGGDARASGAAVLAATALASPYLFNYDLAFLIVPTLWLVEQGRARGFRDYEKLALVLLWLAPYATRAAALPTGVNLMPLASLALLALVWSRGGRDTQTPAPLAKPPAPA